MRKILAVLLVSLVAACARDSATSNSATVWTADAEPRVEISADDSVETIGIVSGVARFADGRIAVGDQSGSHVNFYDPNGKFVKSIGRNGSGPGEFEMVGEMRRCGDTLYVHDLSNGNYSLVSADGQFGRRHTIAMPDSVRATSRSACSVNGKFISAGWPESKPGAELTGASRGLVPFWITDVAGKVSASLGSLNGPELWSSAMQEGLFTVGPRPLGKETLIALGKSRAYVGTADSGLINVFSLDGKALSPIRIAAAARPVTSADIEAFKMRDTIAITADFRDTWINMMKQMKFPETLPAYSALLVDSQENLWVRAFPTAGASDVDWWIFSESGAPVATMKLPSTLSVAEIGADYVAGFDSNPMTGQQRVLVLGVRKGR